MSSEKPDKIRCFLAIPLEARIKEELARVQGSLKDQHCDIRWVRPEGIHLTLKFFGSISREEIDRILAALRPEITEAPTFTLRIAGMGCFPNPKNPRVIWIGVEDDRGRLKILQQRIEHLLEHAGFPKEERPFKPHLTIGRMRSSRGKAGLAERIFALRELDLGLIHVDAISLFQSRLRPEGAVYTELARMGLKA